MEAGFAAAVALGLVGVGGHHLGHLGRQLGLVADLAQAALLDDGARPSRMMAESHTVRRQLNQRAQTLLTASNPSSASKFQEVPKNGVSF